MDPAFWNNLPAIIGAIFGGATTIIGAITAYMLRKNTKVTVEGQEEAKRAIIQTAAITKSTVSQSVAQGKEIATKVGSIEEKLNGGPNGLSTMNERVTSLEKRMDAFMLGQVDIVRSIEHLTTMIQRKQLD